MRRARLVLVFLVLLVAGCSGDDETAGPTPTAPDETTTSTTAPTTTTSSEPTSTTTTTMLPAPTPRASPVEAVDFLLGAWRAGDRVGALTVAEPDAVDTLFAIPPEPPESRGCNTPPAGFGGPTYCVYRLNAGELQVRAVEVTGGWIVDFVILGSG